jgi:hypothetical protein
MKSNEVSFIGKIKKATVVYYAKKHTAASRAGGAVPKIASKKAKGD